MRIVAAGLVLLVVVLGWQLKGTHTTRCGVERWAVKTLTDPAARRVNTKPLPSDVTALGSRHLSPIGRDSPRTAPEFQAYTVSATLREFKLEADSDIHAVLCDGLCMIAELPATACTRGAQHRYAMDRARAAFEARFGKAKANWQYPDAQVRVSGVFFRDLPHGQRGVAPNAAELHPVLRFR